MRLLFDENLSPKLPNRLNDLSHKSPKETGEYINRCISSWTDYSAFLYVLVRKEDDQLIGMIEICINQSKADLGYVLTRSEWGKGYIPEAM